MQRLLARQAANTVFRRTIVSTGPSDMNTLVFHSRRQRVTPALEYFAERFGLRERPFTLLPDPDFLYWSKDHRRAYSVLEYGIMTRAPITVVTGEVGAGKTTLLRRLMNNFPDDAVVGLISNAHGNRGELLQWVLSVLHVECDLDAGYVTKFRLLQDFVVRTYAEGRYVVLIIDEAQQLSVEGLEELRMLTNINSDKDELLQLVMVGQPELREMISRPELSQFAQRVSATYHLSAMDGETTRNYIRHRLRHAGGTGKEFSDEAIALIQQHSRGIPRMVNKLCDFAIVYAVTAELRSIDAALISEVLDDGLFIPLPGKAESENR
jgi:type II secretory pathway predicted ATPase ExeA